MKPLGPAMQSLAAVHAAYATMVEGYGRQLAAVFVEQQNLVAALEEAEKQLAALKLTKERLEIELVSRGETVASLESEHERKAAYG